MANSLAAVRAASRGAPALVPGHRAPGGALARPRPSSRAPLGTTSRRAALPGFGGSSERPRVTTSDWQVPSQLLARDQQQQQQPSTSGADGTADGGAANGGAMTVYTVRLTTSFDRGSALSEPLAGVNMCLIGKNGSAILHRISPVNDPADNLKAMEEICSVVGEDAGADCSSLSSADAPPPQVWPAGKEPAPKPRFQEGSVDEVSFVAPELGPLAAVLLAPEGGSWQCEEVDVSSSRTHHTDRFVCRRRLGGRRGEPAAYLTPVPPDLVVYGTGVAARVVTKEQAAALQAMNMADYGKLKSRLLLTTALLTLGGSGVAVLASGVDAAVPFALGGVAGLLYQLMLQLGADAAVATAAAAAPASAATAALEAAAGAGDGALAATAPGQGTLPGRVARLLGSSAVRLALLTSAALTAVWALQDTPGASEGAPEGILFQLTPVDAWSLGLGICGFLMYKVALVGVSLVPPPPAVPEPAQQQLERNA